MPLGAPRKGSGLVFFRSLDEKIECTSSHISTLLMLDFQVFFFFFTKLPHDFNEKLGP